MPVHARPVEVTELSVPASLDAPGGAAFAASVEIRNAVEATTHGPDVAVTADELLPVYLDRESPRRLWLARLDGRVVGRGALDGPPDDPSEASVTVEVHPDSVGRGVGSALLRALEEAAAERGGVKLVAFCAYRPHDGPTLTPPTGFGAVPSELPGVRFALRHGYRLEQVERASRLPLPVDAARVRALVQASQDAAGPDYRVLTWVGRIPDHLVGDLADVVTAMSTDAPSAGLELVEDVWTVPRLRAAEDTYLQAGLAMLYAAVQHRPSGRLVGYTALRVPSERHRPVDQDDTIVLRAHRGHRLGAWLKAANLEQLARLAPGHPFVFTFNAEENRHMLDVNEALGFVAASYEAGFRKDLG